MNTSTFLSVETPTLSFNPTREEVLEDYRQAYRSRQVSLLGRREVLTGKAKFGIFGDGKELAQVAMAKAFRNGDIRSGYYRDQTFMFMKDMLTVRQFFAQLYAHPEIENDPASAGRQMNGHYATRMLNADGSWKSLTDAPHSSADCSPTASQMPRLVGLGYASKLYRQNPQLAQFTDFSYNGNEIAWGTIGDASTSEGLFWESVNASCVLDVPVLLSVWDDNYGISVPIEHQTTKSSISAALAGMQRTLGTNGLEIYVVKGWDYIALCTTYQKAAYRMRQLHGPALVHVVEVTQPQGHSTSGSHERYKGPDRMAWEKEYDCLAQFRRWILEEEYSTEAELEAMETAEKRYVSDEKTAAYKAYRDEIAAEQTAFDTLLANLATESGSNEVQAQREALAKAIEPIRRDFYATWGRAMIATADQPHLSTRKALLDWKLTQDGLNQKRFNSHLQSESRHAAKHVTIVPAEYPTEPQQVDGREILQACFDAILAREPRFLAFGEDVGFLGDVNQAFAGLQAKYGALRVSDTGIREATIIGQGIGLALRGLRPIAEIQYLDYLLYALQLLSDDLATLQYRTRGGQKAPLIIRTRGHRLEGIWHSGSPMGGIIHLLRGIHVLVPRNMTQAAGFYNTLLQSDEPALVIEVLNGYRLKEPLPTNIGQFTVPIGVPEVLREGTDLTLLTYGPNCRLAIEAADILEKLDISVEVIDAQSLLPFDVPQLTVKSLAKTNRLLVLDEDVPGGASAYLLQQVLEAQGGYRYLDAAPRTLTAQAHRPAYGSDGDYFSKPNLEEILATITEMMHEADPQSYPRIFA
jgi:2-oxoisovalerate dehydrogenase E1 component